MLILQAIIASLGLANAAVVTVTNHVHKDAYVSVHDLLYVENGQTKTSLVTDGQSQPTSISNQVSSSAAPVTTGGASSTPPSATVVTQTGDSSSAPTSAPSAAPSPSSSPAPTSSPSQSGSLAPEATSSPSAPASSSPAVSTSIDAQATSEPSSTSAAPSASQSANAAFAAASSSSSQAGGTTTTLSPSSSSQAPSSASSSIAPSSTGSSDVSDFQKVMVDRHNDKRAKHQSTGSLQWDDKLASYAQNYADQYDCSGNLVHSHGPYGENLAVGYSDEDTIDAWYNEIDKYSYNDPVFSESTGHFTQLVWKSSTKVGCASKQCGGSVGKYIICSYDPAGNFINDFAKNVLPTL